MNTKHEVSWAKYYTTKYWSTQNYFNRIKTTFHYYLLALNKARHADDGYKKNGPREASATESILCLNKC